MVGFVSRRTFRRPVGFAAAVVLVLDALAAFQLGVRAHEPPSFHRGGAFAVRSASLPNDHPLPYTPAGLDAAASSAIATTVPAAAAGPEAVTRAASSAEVSPPSTTTPVSGTYTYAVDGTESATAFGSRRLPATMTMTVAPEPGGPAVDRVLDLRFSDQHEEREIAAFQTSGVSFVYEAGSVTFGPYTQTSEASYRPPMLQVPLPLAQGAVTRGTSDATSRVEDWTVTVGDREKVGDIDTWVVTIHR
ncbi:MAG: hypothetical protein QOI47_1767, partial [Actinomycetota bacterium]|nr:hypothetical protein [Actinomycetota bacterium]